MALIFREEDSIATGALVVDSEIVARRMGVGMEVQMIIAAIFLGEVRLSPRLRGFCPFLEFQFCSLDWISSIPKRVHRP